MCVCVCVFVCVCVCVCMCVCMYKNDKTFFKIRSVKLKYENKNTFFYKNSYIYYVKCSIIRTISSIKRLPEVFLLGW